MDQHFLIWMHGRLETLYVLWVILGTFAQGGFRTGVRESYSKYFLRIPSAVGNRALPSVI